VREAAHRFSNDLRYGDADHQRNTQITPGYVLKLVRLDLGGIGLDPCTEPWNPTDAAAFYTVDDDGLTKPWSRPAWTPSVFVNPPYAKAREPWVERCIAYGVDQRVVLLIPAATDTRIFQRAAKTADAIVFVSGRLKFGVLRPNRRQVAASHPSALLGWNTDLTACSALGFRAASSQTSPGPSS
jgi:phage N-6-adenine-methyltransferase